MEAETGEELTVVFEKLQPQLTLHDKIAYDTALAILERIHQKYLGNHVVSHHLIGKFLKTEQKIKKNVYLCE